VKKLKSRSGNGLIWVDELPHTSMLDITLVKIDFTVFLLNLKFNFFLHFSNCSTCSIILVYVM
jgi:hypothetical protein